MGFNPYLLIIAVAPLLAVAHITCSNEAYCGLEVRAKVYNVLPFYKGTVKARDVYVIDILADKSVFDICRLRDNR